MDVTHGVVVCCQEDEKAKARARENWDWDHFEKDFAVPRDFVLFEFELLYRNGTVRLDHAPGEGLAELRFGGKFRLTQVRRWGWCTLAARGGAASRPVAACASRCMLDRDLCAVLCVWVTDSARRAGSYQPPSASLCWRIW